MLTSGPSTTDIRSALWSVRLVFFLTGSLFATWVARTPTIKDELGLDEAGLATAFAGLNIGAVLGLQLGKFVTLRFGSRATLRLAVPPFALSLSGLLVAGNLAGLTAALLVFAVLNSVVDVAMNAHGVAVEQASGRPLLSGIHACHSLGMIGGSLVGAAVERAQVTLAGHFLGVSVLVAAAAVLGARGLLPSATDRTVRGAEVAGGGRRRWPTRLIVLGVLAFCVALAEGAANDWTAVYLHDETHASTTVAAMGFALFAGSMCAGRLLGDRLVAWSGPVRPFLIGTLAAGLGLGTALLIGDTTAALLGLAVFGLGISCTLPLAFAASGTVAGVAPARAIANVSFVGYLGFFTGPVLIGYVAQSHGLTVGLAIPVLFVLAAAAGAGALRIRH
ncbi:MFS transporter [Nocardia sp. CS682]|uniref:MFS transporter n=1 Tax=Nocardia sp. CS682 TaxID=1047172 RepID=UPI0010C53BF0|nr:MFS transporter [Nocardia sp. CS682]